MIIPFCTIGNSEAGSEPRRGSTFYIPRLRSAIALCTWGLCSKVEPEPRRGSTAATKFSPKSNVHALEHLRLFAYPRKKYSGSIFHRKPQVQSAVALLNLGLKIVEPLRGSESASQFSVANGDSYFLLRVRTSHPPMFFRNMLFPFELGNPLGETPTVSRCHGLRNLDEWESKYLGLRYHGFQEIAYISEENLF